MHATSLACLEAMLCTSCSSLQLLGLLARLCSGLHARVLPSRWVCLLFGVKE